MDDLLQLFASKIEEQAAPIEDALHKDTAALTAGRSRAADLYADAPAADLTDDQRAALGRRAPALQEIATLLGEALSRNDDLVKDTAVDPKRLEALVKLDGAAGRQVYAGQLLSQGGDNGQLLAGAAAQTLSDRALDRAQDLARDQRLPPAQRADIAAAFAEPTRLRKEQADRAATTTGKNDATERPFRAQIDKAEEAAAVSRLLESFVSTLDRPQRP